jgi:hypothetical protein
MRKTSENPRCPPRAHGSPPRKDPEACVRSLKAGVHRSHGGQPVWSSRGSRSRACGRRRMRGRTRLPHAMCSAWCTHRNAGLSLPMRRVLVQGLTHGLIRGNDAWRLLTVAPSIRPAILVYTATKGAETDMLSLTSPPYTSTLPIPAGRNAQMAAIPGPCCELSNRPEAAPQRQALTPRNVRRKATGRGRGQT